MIDLKPFKEKDYFKLPADNIDPAQKARPEYFLSCAKYFYSLYVNNACMLPFTTEARNFTMLRAYGMGKQPIQKYLDILYPIDSFQRKRNMALNNISRDIVKVLPKFINTIMGIFGQLQYDFDAGFIDPTSTKLKDEEKAWLKLMLNEKYQEFMASIGIRPSKESQTGPLPEFNSERQVDLFFQSGGFQLDVEIALRNLLMQTMEDSSWPVLQQKFLLDVLHIGIFASEDYVDTDMRVKGKYIDPDRLICRYSQYADHRDIDFAGYCEEVTMAELRATATNLTESDFARIIKTYGGELGNSGAWGTNLYNRKYRQEYFQQFNCYPHDDSRCTVMTMYWISPDCDRYMMGNRPSDGTLLAKGVPYDYKMSDRQMSDGFAIHESNIDYVYKCKWVVGTDYVYDFGKLDFVPREEKKKANGTKFRRAKLPIHVTRLEGPSMVEMCVETVDQIQLDTMRLRSTKTKIPNAPGMGVVKEALEGITLGNIRMTPRDLMDMFQEDGWLITQRLDDFQNPNGSSGSPIFPIDLTNIYNLVKIYREEINLGFEDLRKFTGISELVDGTTPAPRVGQGVAKISVGASNNTIWPWRSCYEIGYLDFLKNAVLRWQVVNQTEGVDVTYRPFGYETTKVVSMVPGALNGECALRISLRASDEEISLLLQEATQLKAARIAAGAGGITPAQYIQVANIARSGNLKLAQLFMANAEEETRQKDMEMQMAMNEQKAQVDQQSAQVASDIQKDTKKFEHDLDMEYMVREQEEIRKTKEMERGWQHKTAVDQAKASKDDFVDDNDIVPGGGELPVAPVPEQMPLDMAALQQQQPQQQFGMPINSIGFDNELPTSSGRMHVDDFGL